MNSRAIAHHRLTNQGILNSGFKESVEGVRWMGCMQAQDFAGAKWAIGNRIKGITETTIDKDFNEGKILRTHVLRPTWHFVAPEDIRWMLKLSANKIKAMSKGLHRKLEIDEAALTKSKKIIAKSLEQGEHLTREQIKAALAKGKINTDDIRLGFFIMDAEIEGIVCSGGRRGKQFTYALLEKQVPAIKPIDRDASIAELGKRYFMSRGPATVQDFAWWSGLTLADAKKSLEMNKKLLIHEVVNGQAYWFSSSMPVKQKPVNSLHLLPSFDEFVVAYKDRSDMLPSEFNKQTGNGIFKPTIIIDGQVAGIWKRTETKDKVRVDITPFVSLSTSVQKQLNKATQVYAKFAGRELIKGSALS